MTNGGSFGCKYCKTCFKLAHIRVLISSYKLSVSVELGAEIQNMALGLHLVCLSSPVLCWFFLCLFSFCSTKQPFCLPIRTTINPAKEHLPVLSISSNTLLVSLLPIGSDYIVCSSVWQVFIRLSGHGGPYHLWNHDLRMRMGSFQYLDKIEGCCLESGSRSWRVKQHTFWLYMKALAVEWFTKIRFPICTLLFLSLSKHVGLTLRE